MATPSTRNMHNAAADLAARYVAEDLISSTEAARVIALAAPIVTKTVRDLRIKGWSHEEIEASLRARYDCAAPGRAFAAELFVAMHTGLRADETEYISAVRNER